MARPLAVWCWVLFAHALAIWGALTSLRPTLSKPQVVWLQSSAPVEANMPPRPVPKPALPRPLESLPSTPAPSPSATTVNPTPPASLALPAPASALAPPLAGFAPASTPASAAASTTPAGPPAQPAATEEWASPSQSAAYLNNPPPVYPPMSRRLGEQGRVVVRVLIDDKGLPQQAELHTSSGYSRLDRAAVEAVLSWRYVPGQRGGRAQAMWFNVPITFDLKPIRD